MVYPTDEETFDGRVTPEWIRQGHLNAIQTFLKRIQDFLGYGGRLHDETGLVMPVGSIIAYGSETPPSGWLLCDGGTYAIAGSDYVDLYNVIGYRFGNPATGFFSVPDCRGNFLRGWDNKETVTFQSTDVDHTLDKITLTDTKLQPSGIPVRFTTDDTLPAPLVINTTYYTDTTEGNILRFCTSRANAVLRINIDLTSNGAGTSYIHPWTEDDRDTRLKMTFGGNDGKDLGSFQFDEYKLHHHEVSDVNADPGGVLAGVGVNNRLPEFVTTRQTTERGGVETRSRNLYVNYIIKR